MRSAGGVSQVLGSGLRLVMAVLGRNIYVVLVLQPSPAGGVARLPSRGWTRLSRQCLGTVQRYFLRGFDHMEGRCCKRGSHSRQTGAMVYRMGISMEPVGRSDLHRVGTSADGRIGRRVR